MFAKLDSIISKIFLWGLPLYQCQVALSDEAYSQIDVKYSVAPQIADMFVDVKVVLEGVDPKSILEVDIAEQFGSANDYYRDVKDLRITYPENIKFNNFAPNKWR